MTMKPARLYTHNSRTVILLYYTTYRLGQVSLRIQVHGYLIAITDSTTAASLNRSCFASITFVRARRSISSRISDLLSFRDTSRYSLSSQNMQIRYILTIYCVMYILPIIDVNQNIDQIRWNNKISKNSFFSLEIFSDKVI